MDQLEIRELRKEDCLVISRAFQNQGWDKPESQYLSYLADQEAGKRKVLVCFAGGSFAGYLTLVRESWYPGFRDRGIPEISDLNVLKVMQCRGVATALMDRAEILARDWSDLCGIGVGLTVDYGNAQRLYVKRGYVPDGQGLFHNERAIPMGATVTVDDDLVLYLLKKLGR